MHKKIIWVTILYIFAARHFYIPRYLQNPCNKKPIAIYFSSDICLTPFAPIFLFKNTAYVHENKIVEMSLLKKI